MVQNFIGRQHELAEFHALTEKKSASLVALTGRRRVGKSRLVQEFANKHKAYRFLALSGLPPTERTSAVQQRRDFALELQEKFKVPPMNSENWHDIFSNLAFHTTKGKWIILLDEISWMGDKDPVFLGNLKNVWDLKLKNNPNIIVIICGSISSWIQKNIISSTGFLGRISLHLHLSPLSIRESIKFWSNDNHNLSCYDLLKILSVTGGIPRYLEEIIINKGAEANIKRLCFQKEGVLFNEFKLIFSDLFNKNAGTYKAIVTRLAEGTANLDQLAELLHIKKGGHLSAMLKDLSLAGFVEQQFTWNLKSKKISSLCNYRLRDNYLRFYLKYIAPNENSISKGHFNKQSLQSLKGWDGIIGYQFENLVLQNMDIILEYIQFPTQDICMSGPYFQKPSARNKGCQIDYLIQTIHGPLFLFEIKFSRRGISNKVVKEVQDKMNCLSAPKHASIIPVLIHANEVDDAVVDNGFFAHIVDFSKIAVISV